MFFDKNTGLSKQKCTVLTFRSLRPYKAIFFSFFFCLGEEPYSEISPYEILSYVKGGRRMKRPAHCSFEV